MSDHLEELTPEQVHRIGLKVAEIVKMAREDPEFAKEAADKLSLLENPVFQRGLRMLGSATAIGAGVAGGVKAVDMISDKLKERHDAIAKAKYYKEMLDANPELTGSGADAKMVQRHFNTLHKFNPDYASDPMVAGAYVANSMAYARPNIDQLNNVVRARSEITRAQATKPSAGGQAAQLVGKAAREFMG